MAGASTSKRPQRTTGKTTSGGSSGSSGSAGSTGAAAAGAKPSLYQKYMALPMRWKVYIWTTTAIAAYIADTVGNKMYDKNAIEAEAERRVEIELQKQRKEAFDASARKN